MSKYKVITIAIAVKKNRIARFGETVDDSELTVNAISLIEAGSLELIPDVKTEELEATIEPHSVEEVEEEQEEVVTEEAIFTEEATEVQIPAKDAVKEKLTPKK